MDQSFRGLEKESQVWTIPPGCPGCGPQTGGMHITKESCWKCRVPHGDYSPQDYYNLQSC